jgi:hypothetical protein
MWSLKQGLASIQNHLPAGFNASRGVKSLFPHGYTGSVSALKGYVYSAYARLGTSYNFGDNGGPPNYLTGTSIVESSANTYVMADGAGRWFFSWLWGNVKYPAYLSSFFIQSGFVFHFSNDGNAHGFVDTSQPQPNMSTGTPYFDFGRNCISGQDEWIANNWPQIFKAGRHVLLWEGPEAPDPSAVWTGAGFAQPKFTQLSGAATACAATLSGSTLFPFPNAPFRMLSPLGLAFRPLIETAGTLIGQHLSAISKSFTTSNGLTFEVIAPPGMKPGIQEVSQSTFATLTKQRRAAIPGRSPQASQVPTAPSASLLQMAVAHLAIHIREEHRRLTHPHVICNTPSYALPRITAPAA